MSRTTRRGKPSRNYHKYIGLGIIDEENRRLHICRSYPGGWYNDISDEPIWFENEFTTYDEYAERKIRHYHMDYRPWFKCPNYVHRMDIQYHRRQSKRTMHDAIRTGEFDVNLPVMGRVGKRIWEWW